jgi:DNA-binding transcriptional MocR family regulator
VIHLNQAGTSWPKPAAVRQAAAAALEADPARLAADFERHHQGIAAWLGVPSGQLLLTPGGTSALAVGLAALGLAAGDRVLCSSMEHHALHGPLLGLQQRGVQLRVAPRDAGPLDLEQVERELRQGVRLVACCSAANVTGERMPVEELSALCRRYGALLLLDAAPEVGWERRPPSRSPTGGRPRWPPTSPPAASWSPAGTNALRWRTRRWAPARTERCGSASGPRAKTSTSTPRWTPSPPWADALRRRASISRHGSNAPVPHRARRPGTGRVAPGRTAGAGPVRAPRSVAASGDAPCTNLAAGIP